MSDPIVDGDGRPVVDSNGNATFTTSRVFPGDPIIINSYNWSAALGVTFPLNLGIFFGGKK